VCPCHRTRRHHSYGIVIAIAVGRRRHANRFAGSGPRNAQPSSAVSSLYPALSSPYMALSLSSTSASTYMPTSLLPWLGLLVQALPNMKTLRWPLSFCHHLIPGVLSISSVVDTHPCVALPDVIRTMDAHSLLLLVTHCPQWLLRVASSLPAVPVREVLMLLWC
jgi:hypothetical protein